MPEINSVAGQLVGIPVGQVYTAGPGIKIDNVNKIVSVDETVLYESSSAVAQGQTFDLSETTENFERILIYVAHASTALTWAEIFVYPGDAIRYDIILNACDQQDNLILDKFYFSRSGKTITVGVRKRHTILASSVTSSSLTNPACFTKVVGIHRIAGGN